MRVFFDTNVLASAFTARGLCAELYEAVTLNHELVIGEPVIEELLRILAGKLKVPRAKLTALQSELAEFERVPGAAVRYPRSIRDPADNAILDCAIAARVDVFVTGDKALLELATVENMPVLSPRQLWEKLVQERAI